MNVLTSSTTIIGILGKQGARIPRKLLGLEVPLRACAGIGVITVDGADPEDVTLA